MKIYFVLISTLFLQISSNKLKRSNDKIATEYFCGRPIRSEIALEQNRIVSGYDVGYYRYPWYAILIRNREVSCGAALIGPKTIITAAHCYKEFFDAARKGNLSLESVYTVKLGVYNICNSEPSQKEYTVEKVHIHNLYYTKKPYYDISLLTLSGDTSQFEPLCLPSAVKKRPLDAYVPGLGTLKYQGAMPCTVHEARLLIYNDTQCHKMINKTGNNESLIQNAFCAGYLQGGIDTCQGDSGGPLQSINPIGQYVLQGIVSFGFHCAVPGFLGMYTDVVPYLDWIQEKSGLDPGVINAIYNKRTTQSPSNIIATPRPPRRRRPWRILRRPFKIIVHKNKANVSEFFNVKNTDDII